jgi:hypothetical protein
LPNQAQYISLLNRELGQVKRPAFLDDRRARQFR